MRFVKSSGKAFISYFLERQVKKLLEKNDVKVIAVVGSVGKTSTKLAIAKMLDSQQKTLWQEGNYNDRLTVPLVFFDAPQPGIFDVPGWFRVYSKSKQVLNSDYPYKNVVVELGTDGPGQLKSFAYLKPDLTVITAVTSEHMEYFKTLDNVAKEELTPIKYSKLVLINRDEVSQKYLPTGEHIKTYGLKSGDNTVISSESKGINGQKLTLDIGGKKVNCETSFLGPHGAKIILSALAVSEILELDLKKASGLVKDLRPFSGRMNTLEGINNSWIIDDSYNSSPSAVRSALATLYNLDSTQKIALLGNMNELGDTSKLEHKKIGRLCDPAQLDLVVTLGSDANRYLADEAEKNGCLVRKASSPYEAGEIIKKQIQPGALILIKGSQNRVFAEEAIKDILKNPKDADQLVRQSEYWMKIKESQFGE